MHSRSPALRRKPGGRRASCFSVPAASSPAGHLGQSWEGHLAEWGGNRLDGPGPSSDPAVIIEGVGFDPLAARLETPIWGVGPCGPDLALAGRGPIRPALIPRIQERAKCFSGASG